jgi:hypothetical protein
MYRSPETSTKKMARQEQNKAACRCKGVLRGKQGTDQSSSSGKTGSRKSRNRSNCTKFRSIINAAHNIINLKWASAGSYGNCVLYCGLMADLCDRHNIPFKVVLGFANVDEPGSPHPKMSSPHCYMEIFGKIYDTSPSVNYIADASGCSPCTKTITEHRPDGFKLFIQNKKQYASVLAGYKMVKNRTYPAALGCNPRDKVMTIELQEALTETRELISMSDAICQLAHLKFAPPAETPSE